MGFLKFVGNVILFGVLAIVLLIWYERHKTGGVDAVQNALAGSWQVENGQMKGWKVSFTESGATTWVMPGGIGFLSSTDCTVTGSYHVFIYESAKDKDGNPVPDGTYVQSKLQSKSGDCSDAFAELPSRADDKVDIVDKNHALLGAQNLVRIR